MTDIELIEAQAKKEIAEETSDSARKRIKSHLLRLIAARAVVTNLEREYEVLLREIQDAA